MKADDGMSNMNRSRLNSIGGESSHYGGMSEIDTNKYLREPQNNQGMNYLNQPSAQAAALHSPHFDQP